MKKIRCLCGAMSAVAVFLLNGCVSEPVKQQPKLGEVNATKKDFKALEGYEVSFSGVGPLNFKAGEPVVVSFALKNKGIRPLRVPEWRMNDEDNIRLYCQVWPQGVDQPDPDAWVCLDDEVKQPELRYMLELMPDNQVIVSRKLDFAESLVVSPGAERRYFIRAELNLKSLRADPVNAAIAILGKGGFR